MSINGWQRIGIILSVLWAIGGWFWMQQPIKDSIGRYHQRELVACYKRPNMPDGKTMDPAVCEQAFSAAYREALSNEVVPFTLVMVIVSLILAWLSVYCLVWLTRWVRTGFRASQ